MNQKSSNLISFLQIWGILLVVIGHSFNGLRFYGLNDGDNYNCVFTWIYQFHMPLFMLISGYLLKYINIQKGLSLATMTWTETGKFLLKKAKRLLVPYIVISSLVFYPKVLLAQFVNRPIKGSLQAYIDMLLDPWQNVILPYWFLPTLFLIFCIVAIGAKCLNQLHIKHIPIVILILLLILHLTNPVKDIRLLNIGGVANYLFFFALGYYCCKYGIEKHIAKYAIPILCITFSLSIIYFFVPDFFGIRTLAALNGISMSIAFGQVYIKRNWSFFKPYYGASYAIYLLSWFPQVLSQPIFLSYTHAPWQVSTALAIVTGFYVPYLAYLLIKRYRHTTLGKVVAFITGQ